LLIHRRISRLRPSEFVNGGSGLPLGFSRSWVFSPGSGGLRVTSSPESPLEPPVFGSSHRPQRIGSPGFRVSPHEPPDPLFSTSFSHLISLSLNSLSLSISLNLSLLLGLSLTLNLSVSLSLSVGCSGRRAKKTNEEERRKGEDEHAMGM
jgi:hypothetical protein